MMNKDESLYGVTGALPAPLKAPTAEELNEFMNTAKPHEPIYDSRNSDEPRLPIPKIQFKQLIATATLPTRGSEHAAGLDLYAVEQGYMEPNRSVVIKTGVAVAIPNGFYGRIAGRSGLGANHGINCIGGLIHPMGGVIDSDYRGDIKVILVNHSDRAYTVVPGDRIAQLIIEPYHHADPVWADELPPTDRGTAGLGSTGV